MDKKMKEDTDSFNESDTKNVPIYFGKNAQ